MLRSGPLRGELSTSDTSNPAPAKLHAAQTPTLHTWHQITQPAAPARQHMHIETFACYRSRLCMLRSVDLPHSPPLPSDRSSASRSNGTV